MGYVYFLRFSTMLRVLFGTGIRYSSNKKCLTPKLGGCGVLNVTGGDDGLKQNKIFITEANSHLISNS